MEEPFVPENVPPSAEVETQQMRRTAEDAREARAQFASTKTKITETWKQLLQTRDGIFADRQLRGAALNLIEDAELARRREEEEAAGRQRAEAERHLSQTRYRALFESIDEGFCIVDVLFDASGQRALDYRFVEVNPAFVKHTGLADAAGKTMRELAPQIEEFWFETYGRVALTGEPVRFDYRSAALGRVFDVHASRVGAPQERRVGIVFSDVTQRKAAEEALRASEDRLRTLADSVPQIIWTNSADGAASYFNRRWYEYSGLTFEESSGPGWQAIVHPEDAPASTSQWHRALSAGEIFDCEYRLRGRDGRYRWFIGRNVPMRDGGHGEVTGWFGTATDIEDLKAAESALRETEARMRLIVENAREYAIFSMDMERRITSWNSGAHAILGYSQEEALGQSGDIVFTAEDRAAGVPEREAATALAEGRAADERWHRRKDGTLFWASGVMTAMQVVDGTAIGLLKIFRDQTAEVRAREALESALAEAERARADAVAAEKAKDHFLAVLSHELRTPLTPVLMASHILSSRAGSDSSLRDLAEMIRRNIELEADLIKDLLDVTRIGRGKFEVSRAQLDFHEIIRRAIALLQAAIDEKQQRLVVSLACDHFHLTGDAARLQQVVWNLLSNASKFTPPGGEIRIITREADDHLHLEVADTGIGLEEDALLRIFDAFTQADDRIASEFGGLGLGLAIAKAIVDAHGGTINAASSGRNQGAVFIVRLPLRSGA